LNLPDILRQICKLF